MSFFSWFGGAFALCWAVLGTALSAQEMPVVRVAVLQIGTVNWELDTIQGNGFDIANGFELAALPYADNGATRVAFEGGDADVAVVDWIWAARQRAAGKEYVFIPYSKAVGGLVVPGDSSAQSLTDLAGGKIGIAGGPLDKSWLILQAYAEQEFGMDLTEDTEQVYGAPPLIYKTALAGDMAGAINFWHFLAKMKVAGMRELLSVAEASQALGLDPEVPLLGYVMKESYLAEHPDMAKSFYAATRASKALLAGDDDAWEPLRERMNVRSQAEFHTLRDDFRAGIPAAGPMNEASADKLLQLMAELGGEKLVGEATTLPPGLFVEIQ
ncbi:ABC transporter substrate-binding protein [Sedimentitalea sp.]|uniref:ABC transporter substrate-binding protein n=1 Tax=Sedimentitalea sp. TaxID=2048915 RepID=UPI003296ABC4